MEELRALIVDYFGSDMWLYILHPKLEYISPIRYIKSGGSIEKVLLIARQDIYFY